jgi:hypothetical protein
VILKDIAKTCCLSIEKVFIPNLQELFLVDFYQFLDTKNFSSVETTRSLKSDWIEPELGFEVVPLDVDMRWFNFIP